MIERIKTGWTIQRILFTGIGAFVLYDSFMTKEWLGVLLGVYFLYMGVFAKGCAAGYCKPIPKGGKNDSMSTEVEFEEVK